MFSRDKIAWAPAAARLLGVALALAPALAASRDAPYRASLVPSPPPIARQWPIVRAAPETASDAPFSVDAETPALVLWASAPRIAARPDDTTFDVAEALISDERRALANALEGWADHASSIENRKRRTALAAVYAERGYAPLWSDGDQWNAQARALAQRIREAEEDGLDLHAFPLPAIETAPPSLEGELQLSEAIVVYANQAAGGRVDPRKISRLIGARPQLPNESAVIEAVASAGAGAGDALRDFNPPHPGYRALKAKLAELRSARAAKDDLRFAQARDGTARDDGSPSPRKRGSSTLARRDGESRVEAEIIANMERWRWMPRDMGDTRIEVNIPDFGLAVVRGGSVAHRARVIVGKEKTPTPVFSDRMRFIIVNPYWNVPPSILNKEMLPKYGGDVAAIEQSGFQVSYHRGQMYVRQRPGERNALGRIKFMFPNDFSVYLHDTPSRGLFSAAHRAFSHGCVRVDQPFRLAEVVLGPGSGWPEERVRKLVGGSERYINLADPVPIHIEYFTAYVDESGQLQLRGDLYGYSAKVRAALGLEG